MHNINNSDQQNHFNPIGEELIDGVIKYVRLCPKCGKKLYHKTKNSAKQAHKRKANCKECSNKVISEKLSGENAPWFGKKIPREYIDKANKTKSERVYTYYQDPEYKEKRKEAYRKNPWKDGISTYDIWVEKYGKEEADRRKEESRKNRVGKYKGKNNKLFGIKQSKELIEKMRIARTAAGYKNSKTPEFREKMRKISKIKEIRDGRSNYQIWLEKYGKEEADKRQFKMNEGQRKNTPRGENSPHYGKPPPEGTGRSLKGWYKGVFFRSLCELMFLIYLIDNNIEYINLEKSEYGAVYEKDGYKHIYHGDFLVNNEWIEIKPPTKQNLPENIIKKEAAEKLCTEKGWTFKYVYPLLDYELIKTKYLNGDIKPQERFIQRFEDCFRHGKNIKRIFQKGNSTYSE